MHPPTRLDALVAPLRNDAMALGEHAFAGRDDHFGRLLQEQG